ncbi:MAG: prolyl oligopeptidase family serine peptidase [Gammaproteobacteria bacterium]
MLRYVFPVAAFALIASASTTAFAADHEHRLFSADDVFALEWARDPQLDPAGRRIAYARTGYDKNNDRARASIWLVDAIGGAHRPLITGPGSYSSARWSPDGQRMAYLARVEGGAQLRIRYLDDGADFEVAQLLESPSGLVWSPDGKRLAFSMFVPGEAPSFAEAPKAPKDSKWAEPVRVFDDLTYRFDGAGWLEEGAEHVFIVSTDGGVPRQLTDGENDFASPAWLNDDTLLVVGNDVEDPGLDPIESDIYSVDVVSGERQALTSRDGPDSGPVADAKGERVAYLGFDDALKAYQQSDLYVMQADGSEPKNLTDEFDHPVSDPRWSSDGQSIFVTAEYKGHTALVEVGIDGSAAVLVEDLGGTSMGRPYASGSFSLGGGGRSQRIAYTQSRPGRPADVAIVEVSGKTRTLTDLNTDALAHIDLAQLEELEVKSSHDERAIEAWVAKPPGFKADASMPLLLEIHGGPFAMYGPTFAAEIQRYAAEGYVTVYVNPRGSTGYGEEFAQLIDLNYPGEDYDDLMSVVDALIERRYVDPERLFVTGGSGGGVLTAWIVGKTERFAAAATIKPVINWTTMALTGDIAAFVGRHWLRAQPWEDPELYWRLSPISLVGNVKTPTLVMVGEEDYRTPTWEAEQFYGALKLQKVPSALIRVPGASHSIASRPSQLIAKTDNIIGWFRKFDRAAASESAAAPTSVR